MQEVFKWLLTNWRIVLEVVLLIVSVVFLIIKKKPVSSIILDIYKYAVVAVNSAETIKVNGQKIDGGQKLTAALYQVNSMLQVEYPSLDISKYRDIIISVIENILTTPQKKGDK